MSSLRSFLIIFESYSATDLMLGVLICLHVDFCGIWIVGFFGNWLKVKNVIFGSFFIIFASYSATHLMLGVLICMHDDFCGTWILWLHVGFFAPGCMLGSLATGSR